jgi:hypothetical protein
MKKLNSFESYLVIEGLNNLKEEYKKDIRRIIEEGKNPLMTQGYIEMVVEETINKIKQLTLKQK